MSRGSRPYCLRSEGESGVLVGVCKRCAVTHAALGSQSRSASAPSRPDAPTKLSLDEPGCVPILPIGRPTYTGRAMASPADLDRVGRASLAELGDIRIDDVLSFIDRGIEKMPSYMDLYRRWEKQQWAVSGLDFTLERQDSLDFTEGDRKATLWSHRLFFNGEERVTATLAPFVWAAPTP